MAILNYTTSIDFEKTIGEIQKALVSHGANKVVTDYQNKLPSAVTFCLEKNGKLVAYSLPANYEGVMKAMEKDRKVPRHKCTKEQAIRVSWRIVKDWVVAQLAICEAQVANIDEVFLPYMIIQKTGNTLYKELQTPNGVKLLG